MNKNVFRKPYGSKKLFIIKQPLMPWRMVLFLPLAIPNISNPGTRQHSIS